MTKSIEISVTTRVASFLKNDFQIGKRFRPCDLLLSNFNIIIETVFAENCFSRVTMPQIKINNKLIYRGRCRRAGIIEDFAIEKRPSITYKFIKQNEVPTTNQQQYVVDNYIGLVEAGRHTIPA